MAQTLLGAAAVGHVGRNCARTDRSAASISNRKLRRQNRMQGTVLKQNLLFDNLVIIAHVGLTTSVQPGDIWRERIARSLTPDLAGTPPVPYLELSINNKIPALAVGKAEIKDGELSIISRNRASLHLTLSSARNNWDPSLTKDARIAPSSRSWSPKSIFELGCKTSKPNGSLPPPVNGNARRENRGEGDADKRTIWSQAN